MSSSCQHPDKIAIYGPDKKGSYFAAKHGKLQYTIGPDMPSLKIRAYLRMSKSFRVIVCSKCEEVLDDDS